MTPKLLISIGLIFILAGIIWMYGSKYMSWLGRLPGDIRVEKENFKFNFPITTMIFISILVQIFLKLYRWIFK